MTTTRSDDFPGSGIDTSLSSQFRANASLSEKSSPPVNAVWAKDIQLVSGAFELHLDGTAASSGVSGLVSSVVANSDFTGYALQVFAFETPGGTGGNVNTVTVTPSLTNPYSFFGGTADEITLGPGGSCTYYGADTLTKVSATAKQLTIAGTTHTPEDLLYVSLAAG